MVSRQDQAIKHLRAVDPVLAGLIDSMPGFNPRAWLAELPAMDAFAVLLFQITGQQLSLRATRSIFRRVQERFDGHLPSPSEVLAASPDELRQAGLSRRKVQTVRTLAARFVDGSLSEELLASLPDEEIANRLTSVSGIGPWTVHGFLIVGLQREDVVLAEDLLLRKAVRKAYDLDHLPGPDEVLTLAEAWRPYRSLATSYLFASMFRDGTTQPE